MGRGNIEQHWYKDLDDTSKMAVELSIPEVVEKIDGLNYGTHRFLSTLIDVRRRKLAERVQQYRDRGDDDVAEYAQRKGDALMDGIAELLAKGCY